MNHSHGSKVKTIKQNVLPEQPHFHPDKKKGTIVSQEKLATLQAQVRTGGKGTACRKKVVHRIATAEEKKSLVLLKELGVNNISHTEEVTIFTNQGTVRHYHNSKVQVSLAASTFTITGHAEAKLLTESLPSILTQLGTDSGTSVRRLAEVLSKLSGDGKASLATEETDNEVPDLVDNFHAFPRMQQCDWKLASEEDRTQRSYWEMLLYSSICYYLYLLLFITAF
ncbi:LOW QUALITY PROTEIN: transcription factor BTF3-like [Herpailurus yagouaroundi]|uniref:LOW QUALITY PROTEIN: transcription factor BTF3-like n=1 Tax=Herpailurus yagouaroundi TaxID=1608482 RepID=UPI001AD641BE|nr:LOW QUALITY PROTEIN: transcription factor BTF3-like [Puma yagouaroundi]